MKTLASRFSPLRLTVAVFFALALRLNAQLLSPGLMEGSITHSPQGIAELTLEFVPLPPDLRSDAFTFTLFSDNHLEITDWTIVTDFGFYAVEKDTRIDPFFLSTHEAFYPYSGAAPTLLTGETLYLAYWRNAAGPYLPYLIPDPPYVSIPPWPPPIDYIDPLDQIGWAAITRTVFGLELTASATDFSGNGIVVGSFTSIPEPSVYAAGLAGAALGSMLYRRRTAPDGRRRAEALRA